MPKYLFYGSYTPEGFKGLLEEGGSARIEAAKQALQSVGGKMELGAFSISLAAKDIKSSKAFYEKLGIKVFG